MKSLLGIVDASPIDFRARCFEGLSPGWSWESPFICMTLCQEWEFWQELCLSLFYLFQHMYFLRCQMCRNSSVVSGSLSEGGNCSTCSCTFGASVGGGELRCLLCYCLGQFPESLNAFFFVPGVICNNNGNLIDDSTFLRKVSVRG